MPDDPITARLTSVQTVSFKKFGISLNFTPVVLTEGRISLRVMTEVSELSNDNSITLTRPSAHGQLADDSLDQDPPRGNHAGNSLGRRDGDGRPDRRSRPSRPINGLPGLTQLPVLGTLFRSRDFVNNQTELMVLVTPYVVRAVAQKDLSRPDDGFASASDPQADLLGSINRIYGVPGRVEPARNYRGTYGFITD